MRRRRAWPALALRRSPKVVVGLGMQGPRVLGRRQGEMKAKVRNASTTLGHAVRAVLRTSVPVYYKP